MCEERGQTWEGSAPTCAFDGEFKDNWNCATLNAIREICYEASKLPDGVDYYYCEDDKYATIYIDNIGLHGKWIGYCLWVQWYKNRGGTDQMWVLADEPRLPTEEELLAIIKHYEYTNF